MIWPNGGFEADYDEIKLQNIVMKSFQWHHHHYITEKRHLNNITKIFNLGPSRSKFLAAPIVLG